MPNSGDETSGAARRPTVIGQVPAFDPAPSVLAGASVLEADGTPYVLIGGLALGAWGAQRMTKDADFAVPVGAAERAAAAMQAPVVRPLRIGGAGVRDEARDLRVDFIDRRFHFAPLFQEAIDEAREAQRRTRVGDREVPLVSLEHLLAMKLVSGDEKDDGDVRRILRLPGLDYLRAHKIVEQHLGAASASRLEVLARAAGRPEVPARRFYRDDDPGEEA